MAKKSKKQKLKIEKNRVSDTTKTAIVIIICILILMGIMYFITTKIQSKEENKKAEKIETVIQYDKILAGESFDQKEEEYLVIYYDSTDKYSILKSLISTYQAKSDVMRLYSVDLADGMNKKYIGEEMMTESPTTLQVKNPTLLRFKDNKVVEVITSNSEINEYLSK